MANIVNIWRGRQGDKGEAGETGIGVGDIRGSLLDNPVLHALRKNMVAQVGDVEFNRQGEAFLLNRYGNYEFVSSDPITNYRNYSNDFTQWSDFFNRWSIVSTGNTDPFGGNTATIMKLDATTVEGDIVVDKSITNVPTNRFNTCSFWFNIVSGNITAVNITVGGVLYKVEDTFVAGYQRLRVSVPESVQNFTFSIDPVGDVDSEFIIYGVQFESGSIMNDYVETQADPVTVANPSGAQRENEIGYQIEDQKQNIIANSENLKESNWTVEGATVEEFAEADLFNDKFKNVNVIFGVNPSALIRTDSTVPLVNGNAYAFSVFVRLLSGTVDAFNASIGGGQQIDMGELDGNEYTRLQGVAIAGASDQISFQIISPNQNANMIIEGFQLETDNLSSYIRTVGFSSTRNADFVTLPYQPVNYNEPFTLSFLLNLGDVNEEIRYIASNGATGNNEFSVFFEGSDFKVKLDGVTSTFTGVDDAKAVSVVYDGANVLVYKDSFLLDTQANSGNVTGIQPVFYIGGDGTEANNLNGFMYDFRMYNEALTALEIRHLQRVD